MKIGVLNDLLTDISARFTFENSDAFVPAELDGDIIKGGKAVVCWEDARNMPVDLRLDLKKSCFVDRVVVAFSEETQLTSVVLKGAKKTYYKYCAETGCTISKREIALECGYVADNLEIVMTSNFTEIGIESVKLYGAFDEKVDLFPTPKSQALSEQTVDFAKFSSCFAFCEDAKKAAAVFMEKFCEQTGVNVAVCADNPFVTFSFDGDIKANGYKLTVTQEGARIFASDVRGFVMGAECLIKLVSDDGVCEAEIDDAPFCPFRGVHIYLPAYEDIDFTKRLVKYLLSPMGYNNIIFNVTAGMKFDRHPEINAAVMHADKMNREGKWPALPFANVAGGKYLEKDTIRELLAYIRSFGISVVPEIQTLGHVQYITQAYPEIAEFDPEEDKKKIDIRAEDAKPSDFYYHSYCPSNPRSYEIVYDLIDEIVEVFEPEEYVHMGHDEVYQIGVCPVCKTKNPAELFRDDVLKLYNYLKTKGKKMMMWSDMIQPLTQYTTRPAIDMLPKDILMLDFVWYFFLDADIETNLLERGYTVAVGNLYSSHYPRYEKRIRQDGVIGGEVSTWAPTNEERLQKNGKFYDMLFTAQMLWAESSAKEYTLTYNKIITKLMPCLRQSLKNVKYPSLVNGSQRFELVKNDIAFPPVLPATQVKRFEVGCALDSIIFSHVQLKPLAKMPWGPCDEVANYKLCYDDGTNELVPVTNGGTIAHWNTRQNIPVKHRAYRHTGYQATYFSDGDTDVTANGENVTVFNYEHILPKGKKLTSVELIQSEQFDTEVFLVRAVGVKMA